MKRRKQAFIRVDLPDTYADHLEHPVLPRERELILIDLWQTGKVAWARDELVRHNIRLINKIARGYAKRGSEEFFLDLFQEGMIGLLTAIDKFDIQSGNKLSTISMNWIKQSIGRYIIQGNCDQFMRIPVQAGRALQVCRAALAESNTAATAKEAEEYILRYIERKGLNNKNLKSVHIRRALRMMCGGIMSFEDLVVEGDDGSPTDFLEAYDPMTDVDYGPRTDFDFDAYKKHFEPFLMTLDERNRKVVIDRFFNERTLEEIGDEIGVTRERVRQLEKISLEKLNLWLSVAGKTYSDFTK
jgi:RNA polymerase sigma factor (sigma-70 family)